MKITIGHLYPDLLNLYGDRGNIQCLMKRCQWRGIEAETICYEINDEIDFSKLDIILLGGGSDREQMLVCDKLKNIKEPALIINGANDLCTPLVAKTMYDSIPNSRWELFDDCRHVCFVEDTDRYCRLLNEWMEQND